MADEKVLNLGCGYEPTEGAVNHDRRLHSPHVDTAFDLESYPWPLEEGTFDHIEAIDVLEHLRDFMAFFDECWLLLKPEGTLLVRVPRYDSVNVAIDPTHVRGYHPESFDYLDPERRWGRQYGGLYTQRRWEVLEVQDGLNVECLLRVRK